MSELTKKLHDYYESVDALSAVVEELLLKEDFLIDDELYLEYIAALKQLSCKIKTLTNISVKKANCVTCQHNINWDYKCKNYDCRLLEDAAELGRNVEHDCRFYCPIVFKHD
ncbi:MAG: hypothetical protein M0R51_13265 [Clostridia bacterium]|jgi:hypothetical protein|nr:hypothetical protein [Clostridia bacterium]